MRGLRLRESAVGLLLGGMDQVGELDRVLDEEHRDVVSDEIPVAGVRVELDREAAHVARQVAGALVAGHRREPDERRGALAGALEEVGRREVGERLVVLEEPVRAVPPGMNHALGNPLVVEVEDLLAEMEVLQRGGPALADPQGVLIVGDHRALLRGQARAPLAGDLVGLAAVASLDALLAVVDGLPLVLFVVRRHLSLPPSPSDRRGSIPLRSLAPNAAGRCVLAVFAAGDVQRRGDLAGSRR